MKINTFSCIPLVYLINDGRTIELAEDFSFCDSKGRIWTAKKGRQANGTSYPRVLWSLAGGPWSSKSRWAAIIHDVYCEDRMVPWQDVHRMFGEAARICWGPEDENRALFEFNAVWQFGPRWDKNGNDIEIPSWDDLDLEAIGG